MLLTAPDYVFVALYTLAKIAIAFVLTRLFGIILKYKENYDLYISTANLSVASLFSIKSNSNLFKKHGSTATIPIFITLLIVITEGFPTLMTRFTPTAQVVDVAHNLNLTTNNTADYFVPSYSSTKDIAINTGKSTVDVPRLSNNSLVWTGLGKLQQDYTFQYDLNYREQEQFDDNTNVTLLEYIDPVTTIPTKCAMLRYGNISVGLSTMLSGIVAINQTVLSQTPTYLTAVLNYYTKNLSSTSINEKNTAPFRFDRDITGDSIMKKEETIPSDFYFGKLSNEGGVEETFIDPAVKMIRYIYHSFAKIAYFTDEYADYMIVRSGYNIDSPAYSRFSHKEVIETKMKCLSKPQYEIDEALYLLSMINPNISQLFFSVTTVSPGKVRLAMLSHASIHFTGYPAFQGVVRFVAQNITISSFPTNHLDETELINVYGTNDKASAGINQQELEPFFSTDKPIKLRTYGILAGAYSSFINKAFEDIKNFPGIYQVATLSEEYDPKAAVLNLDLARTVAGACRGDICLKLVHIYYRKELSLGVLLGICIPIIIALFFFVITYRSRQDLFFADLPDAIAAVTKEITSSSNENNIRSIPPNSHYIKLVKVGHNTQYKYMTIDDQILKKGTDDQSLTDERTSFIKE